MFPLLAPSQRLAESYCSGWRRPPVQWQEIAPENSLELRTIPGSAHGAPQLPIAGLAHSMLLLQVTFPRKLAFKTSAMVEKKAMRLNRHVHCLEWSVYLRFLEQ